MGKIILRYCDECGIETDNLMLYWQWTDMSARSTEAIRESDKLDLCPECLEKSKSEFKAKKRFFKPREV